MKTTLDNGFGKVLNAIKAKRLSYTPETNSQWAKEMADLRELHGDNTPAFKRAVHDKKVAGADEILETLDGVELAKRMLLIFINLDENAVAYFSFDGHLIVVEVSSYGVELTAHNKNGNNVYKYFNSCSLENDIEKAGFQVERMLESINII